MNAINKNYYFENKTISSTNHVDDEFATFWNEIDEFVIVEYSRSFNLVAEKNATTEHLNIFFNFHIKMHFADLMKKYDVFWNINVLFDENKHRFFKQTVFSINNRKSKKIIIFQKRNSIYYSDHFQWNFFFYSFTFQWTNFKNSSSMFRFIHRIQQSWF